MLEASLQSGDALVLAWAALAMGFIHTILGPDHYVPFVMLAKAEGWSQARTGVVSFLSGLGHVMGSVVIAAVLIATGVALSSWEHTSWGFLHALRGNLAAWALAGFGGLYAVWGVWRALRHGGHGHSHGHSHDHSHDHSRAARVTPWVVFIIFVFGPCESLIPLLLAAWGIGGVGTAVLVAGAFTLSTVGTMVGAVALLLLGLDLVPLGKLERWTHALAGASLVACGLAIVYLGL